MEHVVIAAAGRTPIGTFGGVLKDVSARKLAELSIRAVMARAGLEASQIDEVILGNCIQRTDEPNIARVAAIDAGLGKEVTGFTVQRQCASGMQAIASGASQILLGENEVVIAGGTESMSNAPYVLKNARWGRRLMHGEMTDAMWELLTDPHHQILMGETAERLADLYKISREEQDEIAMRSQHNAIHAIDNGLFAEEIIGVPIAKRTGEIIVTEDEFPRRGVTMESLGKLKPGFREAGTVTAGNASGLNDGASAVVLMSETKAKQLGIEPLGRIVSWATAGVEPDLMGYGPVPAVKKALAKANLTMADMELIEVNEAFAAQYLAVEKLLELPREITNVNGSGISLGHPVGSTGCRIVVTLLHEMKRRQLKRGLATLCVGGGMGMAMILERV
ncbi:MULTISPECIES: thiolase family protein [Brevibacillus]|jgi:acetyl-CoA C-acetyltransferase|uniref:acetyl-CoA C-acetyltransferase n=1 Tax=Brevibacillus parabrevis TaxID=54914 RepID=A0A4Y3PL36_BREPA|nr:MULTISPECIES: acetyl-CoA C-acetyltransferase [Brevibacillus]MBU8713077.1 acetyl-CoA C-acetyltransferase [Brevibacillus parabrevis]MDH6348600.1 acetyl-CoA C-acetyltransferase [Brevibacillus sp. 1238]MED2256311.1 acetyl-CoA C-acetyltransferase [Brevibacillus parabrevis]NRQ53105.1 acetyl-CoA C-acetyltransferase [Brevibacillus sp. HD1.4A]RNB96924.1 acetyl-CoA C-acetyltransferase [Brevibacillus parabrevis]